MLPQIIKILSLQEQNGRLCMWAIVDPTAPQSERHFEILGTGFPVAFGQRKYLGTVQMQQGTLVLHIFECFPNNPIPALELP